MSYQISYVDDDNNIIRCCTRGINKTAALSQLMADIPYLKYRPFNIKDVTLLR